MGIAEKMTLVFSGSFLLVGLLTGVWKYAEIARSESASASPYVDIAHRASLLYAFASLVIFHFVQLSPYSEGLTVVFAAMPQIFFALAILTYVIHGFLKDTDNQLRKPYRLGRGTLPGWVIHGFMVLLILAEIGGFLALFVGVTYTML